MSLAYPSHPLYSNVQSLPEVWSIAAKQFANVLAVHDPHSSPEVKLTYAQLYDQMQAFAAGIQALGVRVEDGDSVPPRIALFSDNCPRWLVADQGIMRSGAVDVVRGAQADPVELRYILEHSGSVGVVLQDAELLKKLRGILSEVPLQFVILLSDEAVTSETYKVMTFSEVLELGRSHSLQPVQQDRSTLATLMYTSGTSGMPKGVMLSHGNLIYEINGAYAVAQPEAGERVLSILPIWHSYERSFEYFIFSNGCTQIYTNIRFVKKDLKEFQPHYMVGVPRLWESIYEGIQKQFRDQPARKQKLVKFFLEQSQKYILAQRTAKSLNLDNLNPSATEKLTASVKAALRFPLHLLGDRLVYQKVRAGTGGQIKFVVSGGGSIADHLEDFFEIVGINILGGYGLTETSPITHARRPWRNVRGADGEPLPTTETRIVDPETRQDLAIGQKGLILLRGHQIMQGYYKNPEATAKAIDKDGWFDTGDLGMVTPHDDLIITGRAKDTIVLTNGENIEPQPIEDACLRSVYIDQIMLVGQDQKVLGALVVPNMEALEQWGSTDLNSSSVQDLFRGELARLVKDRPAYRPDDRIGCFRLLSEPFSIENGLLTQTLKIRRNVVMERYQGMIDEMFLP
ncbi:Long-chain-fatty-acid--CoA ligase [Leptolyngbya boryana NIES-2135]|jgi:long-chain acyl-CoA synthetase|uniref:Long-chain-fatty-acid--CoA ligase n=2 Tax=Leptolyngbya boryana TaxID=1184 RepID=A0A1Z4JPI0_LEPBY|nr:MULTISPECIES: AMP-binding protein [Leptolyngbya]BAY58632.1 Long-chain-fatty-acid--CoA ligase [Leptolyngbya boryana NIES-2135]MBD2371435.1 AMP-binding protein [Leptolyngbya sp. FACHB-161]MBD2377216.1 AMP-binding protein [Leptolyngbya sp. FACHB-238]MBD2402384.1 AMP-binding protein [Leptolyngbya sp. FACHB-239]MBD2408865.1 AMP-binding protein [Leptolyngbya sp. FACHB-402]